MSIDSNPTSVPRLDLGIAMRGFVQSAPYIGTRVFPVFSVDEAEGTFGTVTAESLLRKVPAEKRAPGAAYKRRNTSLSEVAYKTEEYGKEESIDDSQRNYYASSVDLDRIVAEQITNDILVAHEIRVADIVFNTTTFTGPAYFTDVSGSAPFDNPSSNVIGAITSAAAQVQLNCGATKASLSLVISQTQFDNLKANTAIVGRIASDRDKTEDAIAQVMASLLGVKEIIVGGAVKNVANEGQAISGGFIWSDQYAMLCLVSGSGEEGLFEPSLGRTILWAADSPEIVTFDMYREDATRSDVLRGRHNVDELLIDRNFGHLLKIK